MSDYIDREEVKARISQFYSTHATIVLPALHYVVDKISSADVRENVYGEWIKDEKMSIVFDIYRCSRCSAGGEPRYKFCPNCGADMRGDNK